MDTCDSTLDLIKRINDVKSHHVKDSHDDNNYCELSDKCFGEIGCLKYMHHIDIDPTVKVAEIIEGISSVRNSQDDILVWGRNKSEHDATLNEVLQRILDSGLRLNEVSVNLVSVN